MARRIDKIDFHAAIRECCVLGQNGDAAFPFQGKRVHHPLGYLFIVPKGAALFEQGVNKGGFTMIDMSDNGDVSNILTPGRAVVQNPILPTLLLFPDPHSERDGAMMSHRGPLARLSRRSSVISGQSSASARATYQAS